MRETCAVARSKANGPDACIMNCCQQSSREEASGRRLFPLFDEADGTQVVKEELQLMKRNCTRVLTDRLDPQ